MHFFNQPFPLSTIFAPSGAELFHPMGLVESQAQQLSSCSQGCCKRWHVCYYRHGSQEPYIVPVVLSGDAALLPQDRAAAQAHRMGRSALALAISQAMPRN